MDLYAEVAGEGATVVLVHAGICDSRMWDPQWDAFPAAHRTVRYDLRGFGRSSLPPQPYSHGRDLIALLERLGIQRATLAGASLGGRVALEVAVTHPEVVDALILADAALPGFAWSDELRAFWAKEDAALERGDLDTAVEVNLQMWVDGPRRPAAAADSAVRESVRRMQRRALSCSCRSGRTRRRNCWCRTLPGVSLRSGRRRWLSSARRTCPTSSRSPRSWRGRSPARSLRSSPTLRTSRVSSARLPSTSWSSASWRGIASGSRRLGR
jgi:pimeloyl-ACP methyl ester carboxylesterase